MSTKKKLNQARLNKKDEFYTRLEDINRELRHYRNHFKDKVVYCNCDDPKVSNFFHYFSYKFEKLGLKKLVTTSYKNKNMDLFSQNNSESSIKLEYLGDKNSNTNPPFSLFREYVSQLIKYNKKFIIVGHQNAISYKEIFSLLIDNKIWLGYGFKGGAGHFINKHYENFATASNKMEGMIRVSGVVWFTNLDIKKRHEDIRLFKKYNPDEYPAYENFDAINVNKTKDIPCDFKGKMGVPITFINKFNPEQFELIGLGISSSGLKIGVKPYKPEHRKFRKEVQKRGAVDGDLYLIENGEVKVPYARIIIKNIRL